ncbi:hypothetical protein H0H92_005833 [Tricholoma furcatifolium]|nr:hypothetical protein H0H92_005833 [Tricholoma furcatifolium]
MDKPKSLHMHQAVRQNGIWSVEWSLGTAILRTPPGFIKAWRFYSESSSIMAKFTKGFQGLLVSACLFVAGVSAQTTVADWGQCGGEGWTGSTLCPSGWYCSVVNAYYYQCLQDSSTVVSTSTSAGGSTYTSTTTTPLTTTSTTPTSTSTSSAPDGTTTLLPNYVWIRAVEDPYFHNYLQSEVLNSASDAVLGSPVTAGMFNVTADGQLVQYANGNTLYAIVEDQANANVTKLLMSWSTTPATAGTFVFSGDTLEWSIPTIDRPQDNAWLVCPDDDGNELLYINLGYYDYETPTGCSDETIHAYTGATATS